MYFVKQILAALLLTFLSAPTARAEQPIFYEINADALCVNALTDQNGNLKTTFAIWALDVLDLHTNKRPRGDNWSIGELTISHREESPLCASGEKVVLIIGWYDQSEQPSKEELIAFLTKGK